MSEEIISGMAEWQGGVQEAICPKCRTKLERKGKKKRRLQTRGGREMKLEREYGVCPKCGQGIFPLDEELELLPGMLTPHGHECLVQLTGWMPFEKAAEMLEDFMGIRVSKIVSQRYTEEAGAARTRKWNGWRKKCHPRRREPTKFKSVRVERWRRSRIEAKLRQQTRQRRSQLHQSRIITPQAPSPG